MDEHDEDCDCEDCRMPDEYIEAYESHWALVDGMYEQLRDWRCGCALYRGRREVFGSEPLAWFVCDQHEEWPPEANMSDAWVEAWEAERVRLRRAS